MPETLLSRHSEADCSKICEIYNLTAAELKTLETTAVEAKRTAYCPYSKFRVGASILAADGAIIQGANVENASYPVGTCAERVAFGKAVTEGKFAAEGENGGAGGKRGFKALAVATDTSPPASPCGMCRQFIREFCDLDMPVLMFDKSDHFIVMTLKELLPMSFGPENLPSPGATGSHC